jgi:[ribosomal protein S18]-alanine N-acetyltransferase
MSEQTVTIEPALHVDLVEIAELEKAAFSDPWSFQSFESVLAEPAAYMAVARGADDQVAGYVVAWFAADEGEIANLAVREPTRRRGIGAALLDEALAEGSKRGTLNMYLEVRESNVAARRLYASRDFEEIGRRRRYYRRPVEDAIVLRRALK